MPTTTASAVTVSVVSVRQLSVVVLPIVVTVAVSACHLSSCPGSVVTAGPGSSVAVHLAAVTQLREPSVAVAEDRQEKTGNDLEQPDLYTHKPDDSRKVTEGFIINI